MGVDYIGDMRVVYGLENVPDDVEECVVAVGVFDGVHWGHKAIFEQLTKIAAEQSRRSVALTFDRHPAELLAPIRAPYYINTLLQRLELISETNVDEAVVARFEHNLADLSPDEFAEQVLRDKLHARHVVVGSNFRFGKERAGDVRYLSRIGPSLGMNVTVVPSVIIDGGPVSSTRIRELLGRGDVFNAAKLLGRRFALRGRVVAGRQVGRKLGFPTANIETEPRQMIPATGVYAVESQIGKSTYGGVCNIGKRPTFGDLPLAVEVHFMGLQEDIYGKTLDVVFCRRLRDEMMFESAEKLAEQIREDLARASRLCD